MTAPKPAHGGQRIPHDLVPKLQHLRAQGMSCAAIARAIGVGYATALATAPQGLSQTQAAERTMRRMHQCGVVERRRNEAGKYAYGVKT